MKSALLALLFVAAVFAGDYQTEEGVLVLTDSTFEQAINEYDFVLAEFYAPWCGHCKKLAPEYVQAAAQLASLGNVKLAKIDCTVEKNLASKYDIRGYPTLKFFVKGQEPIPYEAGRTAGDIVAWLKKKTGPVSVHINTVEEAQKVINDNEVVVFYFGTEHSDLHKIYITAANGFDDVAFAHTTDEAVRQHYNVEGDRVILFKKFDEGKNAYEGANTDANEIKTFINANRFPSVLNFEQKTAQKIFGEGLNTIFLVRAADEAGEKAEQALRSAAEYLKGKVTLAIARLDDAFGPRLAEYIGVNKESAPAFRLVQPSKNNLKYIFEHEITVDNLKAFYHDFVDNKLKPFFKSADVPASPHEDNVRVLVGKNFNEVVLDSEDDVLVEYYAPWCGHCKSLAPIYSAVASKLKDSKGIVIAKMDATANEVEGLSIQGFPTIKFYPKGRKSSPIDYSGERTEEGFINFLRTNAGNAANLPKSDPSLDEL